MVDHEAAKPLVADIETARQIAKEYAAAIGASSEADAVQLVLLAMMLAQLREPGIAIAV